MIGRGKRHRAGKIFTSSSCSPSHLDIDNKDNKGQGREEGMDKNTKKLRKSIKTGKRLKYKVGYRSKRCEEMTFMYNIEQIDVILRPYLDE